jgi:hypothetical protein
VNTPQIDKILPALRHKRHSDDTASEFSDAHKQVTQSPQHPRMNIGISPSAFSIDSELHGLAFALDYQMRFAATMPCLELYPDRHFRVSRQ